MACQNNLHEYIALRLRLISEKKKNEVQLAHEQQYAKHNTRRS